MKRMNSTLLFSMKEQDLETRKLRKVLAREEEEKVKNMFKKLCKKLYQVLKMQVKVLLL